MSVCWPGAPEAALVWLWAGWASGAGTDGSYHGAGSVPCLDGDVEDWLCTLVPGIIWSPPVQAALSAPLPRRQRSWRPTLFGPEAVSSPAVACPAPASANPGSVNPGSASKEAMKAVLVILTPIRGGPHCVVEFKSMSQAFKGRKKRKVQGCARVRGIRGTLVRR